MLTIVLCAAMAAAAPAQDAEGSKDHPMVSRFPGYFITAYDATDFGSFQFETDGDGITAEGKYWQISYELEEGRKKGGPLEIARNYLNLFTSRGGSKVFEQVDAGGGTMVCRMPASGRTIWLQVDIANSGEMYELTIVEEAAMAQKVVLTAAELAAALNERGVVALHDVQFENGKAALTPESLATLAPVGELLGTDATLQLEIGGHTDNVGGAAANLQLSQDRAAAVKTYLVQTFGVAPDRLTTAGFGDTRPIADNASEAGRARNRRVELVKK
ncbi:MAG: OmpA family protein [Acidobacteria bacterium]|nr:OmpA family protein [Acidobacteriota bacterium]